MKLNVDKFVAGIDSRIRNAEKLFDLEKISLASASEDDSSEYHDYVEWRVNRAHTVLETLRAVKRDIERHSE